MPQYPAFDSTTYDRLDFPYDRIENELVNTPRLIRGLNTFITRKGKLRRRPGTKEIPNGRFDFRVDRIFFVQTEETPQRIYAIYSAFNHTTNLWELYYQRYQSPTPSIITKFPDIRGCNKSLIPHEAVASRGKLYIKSYPAASDDLFGSIIFDGTDGIAKFYPWGIQAPTVPARIDATIGYLNGGINSSTTSLTIQGPDPFPAAPFTFQLDNELITVTGKVGLTFTVTRGVGGTTAAPHLDRTLCVLRNSWATSDFPINVNVTWRYAYCYESITGQVSSRVPQQADPRVAPSATGSFNNLIPKIILTGTADTVNIPFIRIYRTTDGGGRFYLLDTIPNPGATTVTYEDKNLASFIGSSGFNSPVTDGALTNDVSTIVPTTVSNDPPPPNIAPKIVGTDAIQASTPLAYYAGRIWYAIGTKVVYSGNEEITDGVPEECFPSGLNGNFYALQDNVTNLRATADALYITTVNQSYIVTGQTLDSFNLRPIFDQIGSPPGHPLAITRYGNTVASLTHDFQIGIMEGIDEPQIMSEALFTDLVDSSNGGGEFQLEYWADLDKRWLFVCSHRKDNPTLSRQWVLDIGKTKDNNNPFWFTPWDINCSVMAVGRISEASSQRRAIFFIWDEASKKGQFVRLDPTARETQDYFWDGPRSFNLFFTTHLAEIQPGNHINALVKEAMVPNVSMIKFDRTMVNSLDADPYCYFYLDDFWTDGISSDILTDPPRRNPSKGYKTQYIQINEVAERIALEMRLINNADPLELHNISFIFTPTSGA